MDKTERIMEEMAELQRLIEQWRPADSDPEVRWAIYLLEHSLEKRRRWLQWVRH